MKKIFLISLLATALFTSCSDEVINTLDGNTIRFENAFVEQPETRATDLTTDNLKEFHVHGWMTNAQGQTANIFDKVEVRKNGAGVWAYDGGGRYWFGDTKYEFLAFAPLNADYTLSGDHKSLTFTNTEGNNDFIFASANREITGKVPPSVDPVALSFNHLLSRVLIQFKNEFDVEDVTLNVAKLELKGIAKTADLDLTTSTWATPSDKTLVLKPGFPNAEKNRNEPDTLIAAKEFANTEHFYLIPENINAEAYRLNFDVTVWQGEEGKQIKIGEYKHSVAFDKTRFQMGKQYRVLAKLNSSNVNPEAEIQPITFTVDVLPWGQDIESNINIGN
jgi:hypothetical protein